MAKYSNPSRYSLTSRYNTIRGRILDGELVSPIRSVNWQRGKHSIGNDSCAYAIIKYLETRPNRTASIEEIISAPTLNHYNLSSYPSNNGERLVAHMLRELEKPGIISRILD
jgi:hypothetical protein